MYIRLFKIFYKQVNQSILTPREIKKKQTKENGRKLKPKMKLHTAIRSFYYCSNNKASYLRESSGWSMTFNMNLIVKKAYYQNLTISLFTKFVNFAMILMVT